MSEYLQDRQLDFFASEAPRRQITKIRYSHDAVIDMILSSPTRITQGEIARQFGYTQSHLSILMNTDLFRARLAERRDEVVDPVLKASFEERFRALVDTSLQEVLLRVTTTPEAVRTGELLQAVGIGAKALGYGAREAPTINNNFVVALPPKEKEVDRWAEVYAPKVAQSG